MYLGFWRSEYRTTYPIYIETPGVFVNPRRRYHFSVCPERPTWIFSASDLDIECFLLKACVPKFQVRLNCGSIVIDVICVKFSPHLPLLSSPPALPRAYNAFLATPNIISCLHLIRRPPQKHKILKDKYGDWTSRRAIQPMLVLSGLSCNFVGLCVFCSGISSSFEVF